MSIFQFECYRSYLRERIQQMPHRGRGAIGRIAKYLKMHPSRLSQVMNGDVNFTPEQAHSLGLYLGLSSGELEFFLGLVDLGRAGTSTLKEHIRNRLNEFRGESKKLKKILPQSEKTMSEADQAIFYSKWQYIGVLLLASLESGCSFDEMVARLGLNNSSVAEITDFLVSRGLIFNRSGRFEMVVGRTHLPSDSKLVSRHHTNWRLKAIQKHESLGDDELAYSGPVSLSEEDFLKVRDRIISLIKEVVETAVDSKAQKLACLNIDWFEF